MYAFGGCLYDTSQAMHEACAQTWLSADGSNSRADMLRFLHGMSDIEMAEDAWNNWDLSGSQRRTGDDPEEKFEGDFDFDELVAAFADTRKHFDAYFPKED